MAQQFYFDNFGNAVEFVDDYGDPVGVGLEYGAKYANLYGLAGLHVDAMMADSKGLSLLSSVSFHSLKAGEYVGKVLGPLSGAFDIGNRLIDVANARDPGREAFAQTIEGGGAHLAGAAAVSLVIGATAEAGFVGVLAGPATYAATSTTIDQSNVLLHLAYGAYDLGTPPVKLAGSAARAGLAKANDGANLIEQAIWSMFVRQHGNSKFSRLDVLNNFGECFPAGTPISLSDGAVAAIEHIGVGDTVAAFDMRSNGSTVLAGKPVVRLFENITDTWVKLSNGLTVTPGHHFLDSKGRFRAIEDILADNGIVIDATGNELPVTGEIIRYSAETADLYEQAEGYAIDVEGGLALAPIYKKGWKTYNFEVADFHIYIAGGVRVHN